MTDRPLRIAVLARKFSILSRRYDLLYARERMERYVRLYPGMAPGTLADKTLIMNADDTDRLCAQAVVMLDRKGTRRSDVVELLTALDVDRIVAIVYALPWEAKRRRKFLGTVPEWSMAVAEVEDDMEQAMEDVERMTRVDLEVMGALVAGHDPMSAFPDRLHPYLTDELRDHLAEMADLLASA